MLEALKDNSVIWLIVSLCGVLGVPLCIISLLKKNKKEISYAISSYEIIKPGLNKKLPFSILYNNKKVENLSVSKIAIWNSGNQLLKVDDFVDDKQLSIAWNDDVSVLDVSILSETDSDNKFSLTQINNKLLITFDYLSSRDGVIIQIYHDKSSANFSVTAKIKGGNKLKQCYNERFNSQDAEYVKKNNGKQFLLSLYLVFFLSFVLGDSLKRLLKIQRTEPNIFLVILGLAFIIISCFILIYGYFGSKIQIPKKMRKDL